MAPQKLPRGFSVELPAHNVYALELRPQLHQLAMRVIAGWSRLEASMATMAVNMLGNRAETATAAVYASLTTNNVQVAALRNIAEDALEAPLAELFSALLAISSSIAKQRTPIAHGTWAVSPQIPDAVVNVPLQAAVELQIAFREHVVAGGASTGNPPIKSPGNERLRTYKAADFQEIIDRIEKHFVRLAEFAAILILRRSRAAEAVRLYNRLCSEPEIAQALRRLRQDQRSSLGESLLLPYEPDPGDDP